MPTSVPTIQPPDEIPRSTDRAVLKVHMTSGELYVLDSWEDAGPSGPVQGAGTLYDVYREPADSGEFSIPRSDIALLETNDRETVGRFAMSGLSVFTTLMALTTVACIADPKSCFGSCPTFYTDADSDRPVAEAFSSSFARALEERDVDGLGLRSASGTFSLTMRNEALETHAVRRVGLKAVPARPEGETLLTTEGALVRAGRPRAARRCVAGESECGPALHRRDDVEYASLTDPSDLGIREEVILEFGPVSGDVGLVLTARNSFVTTYVFYQTLAYAGGEAGELLAALERGEPGARDRALGVARELGGIEVWTDADGTGWRLAGDFQEAGPIAADRQVVPVGPVESADLRVMLRMAKGSWRLDEARLVEIEGDVTPLSLEPDSVVAMASGEASVAHPTERLTDPGEYLVTVPGDAYRIWFTLPEGGPYDLFLDTRGYYYEWMREGWLAEEDPGRVGSVLLRPRDALRAMAPGFKAIEAEMEGLFWSSRFRREER